MSTHQTTSDKRKPYQKPILTELGDLRTLTLGGTGGRADSLNPTTTGDSFGGTYVRFPPPPGFPNTTKPKP